MVGFDETDGMLLFYISEGTNTAYTVHKRLNTIAYMNVNKRLRRLRRIGLLSSNRAISQKNGIASVKYKITDKGKEAIKLRIAQHRSNVQMLEKIIQQ